MVSLAADGAAPQGTATRRAAVQPASGAKAQKADAADKRDAGALKQKATDPRAASKSGVDRLGRPVAPVQLRNPNMTVAQAEALATQRALDLMRQRSGGATPPGSGGNQDGTGGGRFGSVPGTSGQHTNSGTHTGDSDWNAPNFPGMGAGWAQCRTPDFMNNGEGGGRSFVDMAPFKRWPELPLALDAPDLDGDGQAEDPIPQRPVVIYYAFLEDNMIDFDWEGGEDNLNQLGIPTEDTDMNGVTDLNDAITPGETDGVGDTWVENGVVRDIIPPADPAATYEDIYLAALARMGLSPWTDDRPVFGFGSGAHPDAEAVWRFYQRSENPTGRYDLFENTFDGGLVLDQDARNIVMDAMHAIETVCNVIFIERPGPDGGGFAVGYPFAAQGYALDNSGILVNPGSFYAGGPGGDMPYEPDDDYPWILITSEAGDGNYATTVGAARNDSGPPSIDQPFLIDFDGDGFPDTPLVAAGQLIVLSTLGPPTDAIILDLDADNDVDVDDSDACFFSATPGSARTLGLSLGPGMNFPYPTLPFDANGDGSADAIIDTGDDGATGAVSILPYADTNGDGGVDFHDASDLQMDFDGDEVGDNVFGGTAPSPTPYPWDSVPCERLNLEPENFADGGSIGVIVHELMHHMGFQHEHQRPDRESFVHVNIEHIAAGAVDQFQIASGGPDQYANVIDNFDTSTGQITWTVTGTPTAGDWEIATPVAPGAGDIAPSEDYAVDTDDLSTMCLVTGNTASTDLDGETIVTSDAIYAPEDATIRFAYWLAHDGSIDSGDGLIVQSSVDGGTTWSTLATITTSAQVWRLAEVTVGDYNDSDDRDPSFLLRFIARDSGTDDTLEAGIDRVRVQNPYDFLSLMHYSTYAFGIYGNTPGFEVIEVLPPNDIDYQDVIGRRNGFSQGDRLALKNLYGDPPDPIDGSDPEPCRADINNDGTIDTFDLSLFLQWFNAGDPRADFAPEECVDTNNDNVIDINDDTSTCIDVFDMLQFFIDYQNRFQCVGGGDPVGFNNLDRPHPG
ncbi:MAG: hypothetical protein H6810_03440 [Phycisphaeraceae bacterium]|nr:MAG: hypothetical protein H6810_03440 [Phycisphaeraceae bacterium]